MTLHQSTVDRECEKARQRFSKFPERRARMEFAYQLQGFVASEVERGMTLREACAKVTDLLMMIGQANDEDLLRSL